MATLSTYDFKRVSLIIGGLPIGGYDDDGGIVITPVGDIGEVTFGADGLPTFSRSNNKGAEVVITVKDHSLGYKNLNGLLAAQELAPRVARLNFTMVDNNSGEAMSDAYFVFTKRPTLTKTLNASAREFTGILPDGFALGQYSAAPLITP